MPPVESAMSTLRHHAWATLLSTLSLTSAAAAPLRYTVEPIADWFDAGTTDVTALRINNVEQPAHQRHQRRRPDGRQRLPRGYVPGRAVRPREPRAGAGRVGDAGGKSRAAAARTHVELKRRRGIDLSMPLQKFWLPNLDSNRGPAN